jgi:hypothetical protein
LSKSSTWHLVIGFGWRGPLKIWCGNSISTLVCRNRPSCIVWPFVIYLQLPPNVALSHVSPLSFVLPYFPILMLSSLHPVLFRHPYFIHMKSDMRNFLCYAFSTSFSSHLLFRFPLEEKNVAFKLWEGSMESQVSEGTPL